MMKKLNKKQKSAIAIAEDVLAQLKIGRYNAVRGVYLETSVPLKEGDLQSQLKKNMTKRKPCAVCAVGSMFISKVRLDDNFIIDRHDAGYSTVDGDLMCGLLEAAFTPDELSHIESAFENYAEDYGYDHVADFLESLDDKEALKVLMTEVIRQGGMFDPEEFDAHLENLVAIDENSIWSKAYKL